MEAARERLADVGCSVLVVSQAKPRILEMYERRQPRSVPVVCDPERAAYRAFGLERTTLGTFLRPKVLWGYFRGMFRGQGVKKPYEGEDVLQLGGDFILNRARRVVFSYPSADPTDRPSIESIIAAVASVRPMPSETNSDGAVR